VKSPPPTSNGGKAKVVRDDIILVTVLKMIIQECNVSGSHRDCDHEDNGKKWDIILWVVGIKPCSKRQRGNNSQHEVWAGPKDLCFFVVWGVCAKNMLKNLVHFNLAESLRPTL
jgi:hypothetical protein